MLIKTNIFQSKGKRKIIDLFLVGSELSFKTNEKSFNTHAKIESM